MRYAIHSRACVAGLVLGWLAAGCGNVTAGNGFYPSDAAAPGDAGPDAALGDATGSDTTAADVPPGADAAPADAAQPDASPADVVQVDAQPGDTAVYDVVNVDAPSADGVQSDAVQVDAWKPDASPPDVSPGDTGPGCTVGQDFGCLKTEYCAGVIGVCGGTGTCTTKPQICPMIESPVCGCDGQTYGNSCLANSAGVTVSAPGQCGSGNMCGGIAGFQCKIVGQFCDVKGCFPDAAGSCVNVPIACPKLLAPVCGCDGKTYNNDCERQVQGVAKDHDGQCVNVGTCTVGVADGSCGKSQFCQGSGIGVCSGNGVCTAIPMMCPDIYSPVCGCDGTTYPNECSANGVGMNVQASGACGVNPGICGGFAGIPCPPGGQCDIQGCGADMSGTCVPFSGGPCPKTTPDAQECGCDGNTYANSCERLLNSIAFDHAGPCNAAGSCTTAATCPAGEGCLNGVCQSCPGIPCNTLCMTGYIHDPCTCACYKP